VDIVAVRAFSTIASTHGEGMAMESSHGVSKSAPRLLDPRFEYRRAAETDIAATWRRFGFDPRANEQRRRLVLSTFAARSSDSFSAATCTVANN
jgi:hypothetical protein